MEKIKNIFAYKNIDRNIDNNSLNIDNSRYSLNNEKFFPQSEETSTAKEIASDLRDTKNYAFYRRVVQRLGESIARRLLSEVKDDVRVGELKGRPIRNPASLYNWKAQKHLEGKAK